jgi:hypothetical protein
MAYKDREATMRLQNKARVDGMLESWLKKNREAGNYFFRITFMHVKKPCLLNKMELGAVSYYGARI